MYLSTQAIMSFAVLPLVMIVFLVIILTVTINVCLINACRKIRNLDQCDGDFIQDE